MNLVAATKPQAGNAWLFDICRLSDAIAVSTSTHNIALFDRETLAERTMLTKAHEDTISALVACPNDVHAFYSASRDGTVKCWDPRTRGVATRTYRAPAGVLSLAHHGNLDKFALGTEFKSQDAVVAVHDPRSPQHALVTYPDCHGDDVTSLSWHPGGGQHLLLSGGGDGLINVLDTSVVDEDDAVLQVLNHGASIHLAQFVGKNEVLAFSHMESASLYRLSYNQESVPRDEVREYGDVRHALGMDYAISFDAGAPATLYVGKGPAGIDGGSGGGGNGAAGGGNEGHVSLIPFSVDEMAFRPEARVDMPCGTEVVRSVYMDHAPDALAGPLLYAASEDGILRVFSRHGPVEQQDREARKRERRESKSARKRDALRFEPY